MNSTIFVQPSIKIPTEPIAECDSKHDVSLEKRKPVAAVIRPVPRETGKADTIRIDPAKSKPPQQHLRTNELFAYVNWLKAKIEADIADSNQGTQVENLETTQSAQADSEPIDSEPIDSEPVDSEAIDSEPIESVEVTLERVDSVPVEPEPIVEGWPEIGNFSVSDSFFSTIAAGSSMPEPDAVESVARTVDPPEALVQTPAQETNTSETTASETTASETTASETDQSDCESVSSSGAIERVDEAHSVSGKMLPRAHVTFSESDPELAETTSIRLPEQGADAAAFIETVSKAIASVLTGKPGVEFENRLRAHFESEFHGRTVQSASESDATAGDSSSADFNPTPMPVTSDEPSIAFDATSSPTIELTGQSDAVTIASELADNPGREIPTSVAAWDVEEFRWPIVTNQMIVSGGEAIDHLLQSTLNLVSPSRKRVAVLGATRGSGTTSIAISLARWAAACGKNVLLVDADIASPNLSQRVGLAPNLSWINAVSQSLPPAEVIVRSQKTSICIMPMATKAAQVIWPRCVYDNLGQLLDSVQEHFDLILLDIGPGSQLLDELSQPELLVDATLLVHDGVASLEPGKMKHRLESFGLSKFIIAQNRAAQRSANVA